MYYVWKNIDEDWIQCFTCKDWAHENCVEICTRLYTEKEIYELI